MSAPSWPTIPDRRRRFRHEFDRVGLEQAKRFGDGRLELRIPAGGDVLRRVHDLDVRGDTIGFDSPLGGPLQDRNGDGRTNEDDIEITETDDGDQDDWLFNGYNDDPTEAPWVPPWPGDSETTTRPTPASLAGTTHMSTLLG